MSKLLNIAFWLSLIFWMAFLLTIMVIGAMNITKWGGISVWVWPIASLGIFTGTVALKGLRSMYK